MAIQKCLVKIVNNRVVCDATQELEKLEKEEQVKVSEMIKNKAKMNHLIGIGMDLSKYHPLILRTMIDGGRSSEKIPDTLKHQLINFANEAHIKGFKPSMFGYNTTLHKFIKTVHNIPKRKYIKKHVAFQGGNIQLDVQEEVSSSSSSESETDLDGILSDMEEDIKGGNIPAVKKTLKKYKHRIPKEYYKKLMNCV